MDILYYSNYCKHSKKILDVLVKNNMSERLSFICIDKRIKDEKTNQTFIVLENGGKVILPPNIARVPCLLCVKNKYNIIYGDEIMKYFHKDIKAAVAEATQFNGEPMAYSFNGGSGGTNIFSEKFTSLQLTPDELSAKGNSSNRPLHNYVAYGNDIQLINTPDDKYQTDKISSEVTVDTLREQRMSELEQNR